MPGAVAETASAQREGRRRVSTNAAKLTGSCAACSFDATLNDAISNGVGAVLVEKSQSVEVLSPERNNPQRREGELPRF